ncbi:MAG: HIT-like protein [Candidatus Dependentiae bacterium ADurb.Bin331]|nr:MAG: HIT-like protein [Candidatus Dependentiae bacterium ADurb.Bin331]
MSSSSCIFCKIISHQIPAKLIDETNNLIVIADIAPKASIHYLIIPKKHVADIQSLTGADAVLAGEMIMMAQKLSQQLMVPNAFKLVINSGAAAGQHVFHLHMHFLSGKVTDPV